MAGRDNVTFYHYTSSRGRQAILNDGAILPSSGQTGDAVFGKGVYGTNMDPYIFSKTELARNNYDGYRGFWEELLDVGRVDYAIKVSLPRSSVQQVSHQSRDIMLHRGHIDLQKYDYTVHTVPEYCNYSYYSDSDEKELYYGPPGDGADNQSTGHGTSATEHLGHDRSFSCESDSGCWNYSGEYEECKGDFVNPTYGKDVYEGDDRDNVLLERERYLEMTGEHCCEQCGAHSSDENECKDHCDGEIEHQGDDDEYDHGDDTECEHGSDDGESDSGSDEVGDQGNDAEQEQEENEVPCECEGDDECIYELEGGESEYLYEVEYAGDDDICEYVVSAYDEGIDDVGIYEVLDGGYDYDYDNDYNDCDCVSHDDGNDQDDD